MELESGYYITVVPRNGAYKFFTYPLNREEEARDKYSDMLLRYPDAMVTFKTIH